MRDCAIYTIITRAWFLKPFLQKRMYEYAVDK